MCRSASAARLDRGRMWAHQAAGFAYWLLAAIYLLAALGGALASGHVGELPVELAVRAPALLIAGPVAASEVLGDV